MSGDYREIKSKEIAVGKGGRLETESEYVETERGLLDSERYSENTTDVPDPSMSWRTTFANRGEHSRSSDSLGIMFDRQGKRTQSTLSSVSTNSAPTDSKPKGQLLLGRGQTSNLEGWKSRRASSNSSSGSLVAVSKRSSIGRYARLSLRNFIQNRLGKRRSESEIKESVQQKWARARARLLTITRLNRIRNDVILYGTSSHLGAKALAEAVRRGSSRFVSVWKDEEEPEERISCGIIHPRSRFKSIWNIVLVFLLLYTATIMPYRMFFIDENPLAWVIIDLSVNALFFLDVLVNLSSAYYDQEGELVADRKRIVKAYAKSWMLLDIIACIPFQLIESGLGSSSEGSGESSLLQLLRLPRLYRLLRLTRLVKMLMYWKNSSMSRKMQDLFEFNAGVMKVFSFIVTILLSSHLIACFWYFAAKIDDLGPETWVVRYGVQDDPVIEIYLCSIYWAVTTLTTVGYGDITPYTNAEYVVCLVWIGFGIGFYSYTIGSLSGYIANIDSKNQRLNKKMIVVNDFTKETRIPVKLKGKMRRALEYSTQKDYFASSDKKRVIIAELPVELQYEIALKMYGGAVTKIPLFYGREQSIIAAVVPVLVPMQHEEPDYVYREGDHPNEMFFIIKGRVHLVFSNQVPYKTYVSGSYFGEIDLIFKQFRYETVFSEGRCEFLALDKKHFEELFFNDFPEMGEEMTRIAQMRRKRNIDCRKRMDSTFNITGQQGQLKDTNFARLKSLRPLMGKEKSGKQVFVEEIIDSTPRKIGDRYGQARVRVYTPIEKIEKKFRSVFGKPLSLPEILAQREEEKQKPQKRKRRTTIRRKTIESLFKEKKEMKKKDRKMSSQRSSESSSSNSRTSSEDSEASDSSFNSLSERTFSSSTSDDSSDENKKNSLLASKTKKPIIRRSAKRKQTSRNNCTIHEMKNPEIQRPLETPGRNFRRLQSIAERSREWSRANTNMSSDSWLSVATHKHRKHKRRLRKSTTMMALNQTGGETPRRVKKKEAPKRNIKRRATFAGGAQRRKQKEPTLKRFVSDVIVEKEAEREVSFLGHKESKDSSLLEEEEEDEREGVPLIRSTSGPVPGYGPKSLVQLKSSMLSLKASEVQLARLASGDWSPMTDSPVASPKATKSTQDLELSPHSSEATRGYIKSTEKNMIGEADETDESDDKRNSLELSLSGENTPSSRSQKKGDGFRITVERLQSVSTLNRPDVDSRNPKPTLSPSFKEQRRASLQLLNHPKSLPNILNDSDKDSPETKKTDRLPSLLLNGAEIPEGIDRRSSLPVGAILASPTVLTARQEKKRKTRRHSLHTEGTGLKALLKESRQRRRSLIQDDLLNGRAVAIIKEESMTSSTTSSPKKSKKESPRKKKSRRSSYKGDSSTPTPFEKGNVGARRVSLTRNAELLYLKHQSSVEDAEQESFPRSQLREEEEDEEGESEEKQATMTTTEERPRITIKIQNPAGEETFKSILEDNLAETGARTKLFSDRTNFIETSFNLGNLSLVGHQLEDEEESSISSDSESILTSSGFTDSVVTEEDEEDDEDFDGEPLTADEVDFMWSLRNSQSYVGDVTQKFAMLENSVSDIDQKLASMDMLLKLALDERLTKYEGQKAVDKSVNLDCSERSLLSSTSEFNVTNLSNESD